MHKGRPTYGMMVQPFTGERFIGDCESTYWTGGGLGKRRERRRLTARRCGSLNLATVMTTSPLLYTGANLEALRRLEAEARLVRYGCDCYAFAMLAAGHVDCVVETGLKSYDVVALMPIIEGAGGIITTWEGGNAAAGGDIIASGDERLHALALARLKG
jgi:myo-inositol-1(or 4)-monophosphatase